MSVCVWRCRCRVEDPDRGRFLQPDADIEVFLCQYSLLFSFNQLNARNYLKINQRSSASFHNLLNHHLVLKLKQSGINNNYNASVVDFITLMLKLWFPFEAAENGADNKTSQLYNVLAQWQKWEWVFSLVETWTELYFCIIFRTVCTSISSTCFSENTEIKIDKRNKIIYIRTNKQKKNSIHWHNLSVVQSKISFLLILYKDRYNEWISGICDWEVVLRSMYVIVLLIYNWRLLTPQL